MSVTSKDNYFGCLSVVFIFSLKISRKANPPPPSIAYFVYKNFVSNSTQIPFFQTFSFCNGKKIQPTTHPHGLSGFSFMQCMK